MTNYSRGSLWSKWDLHVHTPASLVQDYGGDTDEVWEEYLTDLESLPPEFKVIGINDYIFLDGYKKVLAAKLAGRLPNIDLILPVVELRLDKFGGTAGALSRVNFHVIFSNEIEVEDIQQQFINMLFARYQLTPAYEEVAKGQWKARATRESLIDLGQRIKASVPENERGNFSSDLMEGFNNINFNFSEVKKLLDNHYFEGKFFTAVGKTEWWNIKWNDQSIADKKTIINSVDMVFVAAETIADCQKAKSNLAKARVNCKLLDCSDAHHFMTATHKDRIGNCNTWIKADPTFDGLRIGLIEPEQRIFLGHIPEKLKVVRTNKARYMKSLHLEKMDTSTLVEKWFENIQLDLNPDLIAIIGNKGSGKSALTDIIGLLGNTRNHERFSFLSPQRFRMPSTNKAAHYQATVIWENNRVVSRNLDQHTDDTSVELTRYIPQGLFDDICNEVPGGEEKKFDKELKEVIFSHVPIADRLGFDSLDQLLEYETNETQDAIAILKSELHDVNEAIVRLEEQTTQEYKRRITSELATKRKDLELHEQSKPNAPIKPDTQEDTGLIQTLAAIDTARSRESQLRRRIEIAENAQREYAQKYSSANRILEKIENFQQQFENFENDCADELQRIDIPFSAVVQLQIDDSIVVSKRDLFARKKTQADRLMAPLRPNSLVAVLQAHQEKMEGLQSLLDEPNRKYRENLSDLEKWELKRQSIIGDENTNDTIAYYTRLLQEAENAKSLLDFEVSKRLELIKQIYEKIKRLAETYKKLYKPVQDFIDKPTIAKGDFPLNFDVSLVNVDFHMRFFDWIGRNVTGSFYGTQEGEKQVRDLLERHDFNLEQGLLKFLDEVMDYLTHDRREGGNRSVQIADQLKKGQTPILLYDYIFSLDYLKPRYILKFGDKELSQLSPGEKGTLLLIFYLLVDNDDTPLIIDQPEENLDNQTVYELLLKCIVKAKERRQIIIATHNPNIAVVCDAEQVICCSIDKTDGNRIGYITGSIENPVINEHLVDILEGTKPAFNNRKLKYK